MRNRVAPDPRLPRPAKDAYKPQYGVIVICENEARQKKVYAFLRAQKYSCRVVVT